MTKNTFYPFLALCLWVSLTIQAADTATKPAAAGQPKYEIGGPLAGVPLPPYPTYFGEPAGKPGNSYGAPQLQLYPGSVENWRAYWFKYLPVRSIFDRQSQLHNWVAPKMPGCSSKIIQKYAQPVYHVNHYAGAKFTGHYEPAVPVIQIKPGDTIVATDLGDLREGMYCLRVIAAVEKKKVTSYRKDLFAVFTVNDKVGGGISLYKKRIAYNDQFYSIMEFYFHAPEKRAYQVKLTVDPQSKIEILVHNVSFDDVLSGFIRRPIKTQAYRPLPKKVLERYTAWLKTIQAAPEKRDKIAAIDDIVWQGFPRLNTHHNISISPGTQPFPDLTSHVHYGAAGKTWDQLRKEVGSWREERKIEHQTILMTNSKLKLSYSMADLAAYKPLPAPYPVPDNGLGVSQADSNGKTGWFYAPVAEQVTARIRAYQNAFTSYSKLTPKDARSPRQLRNLHFAMLQLIRFAYDYPGLDPVQDLGNIICMNGPFGRQYEIRQRATTATFLNWYTEYGNHLLAYDRLYDLIKADPILVASVGRHIPWVKTSDDLIQLLDMYLVQNTVRRIMRYQYYTYAQSLIKAAYVTGDKDVTAPWIEWACAKSFRYGFVPQGIDVLTENLVGRSGLAWKGSSFYSLGEASCIGAEPLQEYCDISGNTRFAMFNRYHPKNIAGCYTPLSLVYAGYEFARIGDVTGPDKTPGASLNNSRDNFRIGWKYTHDPIFAPLIVYLSNLDGYTPAEQAKLKAAAAKFKRMPTLTQVSRFVPNWCGILETGKRHDDFRFRRGAMVRVGYGFGHHHNDSLDLQLAAHGVLMTVDGGQRPGYTNPGCRSSSLHNLVTVNHRNRELTGGWVGNIVDNENFAYLSAHAGALGPRARGARQVMLVDENDDGPARTLPITQQRPNVKLPKIQSSPNGYLFDVFRETRSGKQTYHFHAMVNDDFQWNATDQKKRAKNSDGDANTDLTAAFTATAPKTLEATWRLRRLPAPPHQRRGSEKMWLGKNFDPDAPRKFLRLHLLNVAKAHLTRENAVTVKRGIENSFTYIGAEVDAPHGRAFTAIIEPFEGKPFIQSVRRLAIPENETDALAATAVRVQCVNGRNDWLFADGRPEKTRQVDGVTVSAEAALLATDRDGLKYAMITGGAQLRAPNIEITCAQRAYTGAIAAVDYFNKTFTLNRPFPLIAAPRLVEIGNADHRTAFTISRFAVDRSNKTVFTTRYSPMLFTQPIASIDPKARAVRCTYAPRVAVTPAREWTVSNDDATKTWRTQQLKGDTFLLPSAVSKQDFPRKRLILWEFGVGDTVRWATRVTIRRVAPQKVEISSNVAATIRLPGKISYSLNHKDWISTKPGPDGWSVIQIKKAP